MPPMTLVPPMPPMPLVTVPPTGFRVELAIRRFIEIDSAEAVAEQFHATA